MIKYDPDLAKREIKCFFDISILIFGTYNLVCQCQVLRFQAYINLIVTYFETIRLILAKYLKCFTQNFQNGGIFTIHMRKADLKTDL